MTTENQSILTQRHGVESLPAAWRNTFEMHGLEWDAGYNAARIACADELAATLTQQQGGEQEADVEQQAREFLARQYDVEDPDYAADLRDAEVAFDFYNEGDVKAIRAITAALQAGTP